MIKGLKNIVILSLLPFAALASVRNEVVYPKNSAEDTDGILSKKYWQLWEAEMPKIDADIEKYRKADAEVKLENIAPNSLVKVNQISSDFIVGAAILRYNRAGSKDKNEVYRNMWGTLFNQATVPFYWKFFEMNEGEERFANSPWDEEEFLNNTPFRYMLPHNFTPASDEVVSFLRSRGVRIHGHPLFWGNKRWNIPEAEWIYEKYADATAKKMLNGKIGSPYKTSAPFYVDDNFKKMSDADAEKCFLTYAEKMKQLMWKRIERLAAHYGDAINGWDIVNESGEDFNRGILSPDKKVCMSHRYGILFGDYTYEVFKKAENTLPKNTVFSINDYNPKNYVNQIKDLLKRGCKIDMVGFQRHLWNTNEMRRIAEGSDNIGALWEIPRQREILGELDALNIPIHISEVTILPTERTARGYKAQATILRNYYKLWFSIRNMAGITYWRTIDTPDKYEINPDEPNFAGLLDVNAEKRPAYYAIDDLINKEWKTRMEVKPNADGVVKFRGFRGKYKIQWTDADGNCREKIVHVE